MAFNVHYCMGKIASAELENFKQDACKKCGAENKKSCCKTELKVIKLNNEHQQVICTDVPLYIAETFNRQPFQQGNIITALLYKTAVANAPPLIKHQPVYLKNCVLLI